MAAAARRHGQSPEGGDGSEEREASECEWAREWARGSGGGLGLEGNREGRTGPNGPAREFGPVPI